MDLPPLPRGSALVERVAAVPPRERDAWVDRLLGLGELPDDAPDLPRGAVPYLPCGVEEILASLAEAPVGPADHFVDLGSGLGRVVLLAHLVSGARASGLEIQAHLVERARAHAAALGLASAVSFVHADASTSELDGSVFFLYAPCSGAMLAALLARLEAVARRRAIVVCTVGMELGEVPWLRARPGSCPALTLHDSCDPAAAARPRPSAR